MSLKVKFFIIAISVCCNYYLHAQLFSKVNSVKQFPTSSNVLLNKITPLNIGDRVPNIEFLKFDDFKSISKSKFNLFDFNEDLIIIDFWSTWCSTCIAKFSALDSLQRSFDGELRFILVNSKKTKDSDSVIQEFLNKRENATGDIFRFTMAISDTMASKLFKHISIPHYVWIKKGIVKAVTSSEYISEANIRRVLSSEDFFLPVKDDLKKFGLK